LDNAVIQKIQFEIEQIDELLDSTNPLFDLCKIREPDFVENCGIALILQSFYNGIEKIVLLIIKNKDSSLPNGNKWHKELFDEETFYLFYRRWIVRRLRGKYYDA